MAWMGRDDLRSLGLPVAGEHPGQLVPSHPDMGALGVSALFVQGLLRAAKLHRPMPGGHTPTTSPAKRRSAGRGRLCTVMSSPLDYASSAGYRLMGMDSDADSDDEGDDAQLEEDVEMSTLAAFEAIMHRLNTLETRISDAGLAAEAAARSSSWPSGSFTFSRVSGWLTGGEPAKDGSGGGVEEEPPTAVTRVARGQPRAGQSASSAAANAELARKLCEDVQSVKRSVLALVSATSTRYNSKPLAYVAPGWGLTVLHPISSPASANMRPAAAALQAFRKMSSNRASVVQHTAGTLHTSASAHLSSARIRGGSGRAKSAFALRSASSMPGRRSLGVTHEGLESARTSSSDDELAAARGGEPWQMRVLSADEVLSDGFSAFEVSERVGGQPVTCVLLTMLQHFGLFRMLPIDPAVVARFGAAVDRGMSADNPYHNAEHAAEVTQRLGMMMQQTEFHKRLTATELFAALVAAAAHDFEHLGVNNNFLVTIGATYAHEHNDCACQENHSLVAAFTVMDLPGCDVRGGLNAAERAAFRSVCIQMVQATDMSRHFDLLARFTARRQQADGMTMSIASDRLLMLMMLIKAADISNSVKVWDQQREWAERVQAEFFAQGDMERELGLPMSPLMDRECGDVPAGQIGFLDMLAKPLFVAIADELPALKPLVARLEANRQRWASAPKHRVWSKGEMRHQTRLKEDVRAFRRKRVEQSLWELSGEPARVAKEGSLSSESGGLSRQSKDSSRSPSAKKATRASKHIARGGGKRIRSLGNRVGSAVGTMLSPLAWMTRPAPHSTEAQ